jgi:broad specificity phosphatase PhoE
MAKVCKIILVRHGESVNNKAGIIAGDSPLTDKGREQARLTRKALAGLKFDVIYSSDLKRAVETAQIIAGKDVPENHQLPGLRERDFGALEGKPEKLHEEEHEKRVGMSHEENWVYKHVPDTESDHELSDRFVLALQKLAENNPGKTILVAAHGGAIRTTLMKLHELTYHQVPNGSFKNAGYVELDYANHNFKVVQIVGVHT